MQGRGTGLKNSEKGFNSLVILVAWRFWKHRNACVFMVHHQTSVPSSRISRRTPLFGGWKGLQVLKEYDLSWIGREESVRSLESLVSPLSSSVGWVCIFFRMFAIFVWVLYRFYFRPFLLFFLI